MKEKVILKESFTEIIMDEESGILHAKWKGFLSYEQVKKGCEAMTDHIKKHRIKAHLSDHRELKVLSKDVQNYLTMVWFPEVEKEGLVRVGALVSEDVFAKATVDKVNKVELGKLTIDTFHSKHDCEEWLSI